MIFSEPDTGSGESAANEDGLQTYFTLLSLAGSLSALPARMVFAGPEAALNSASRCSVAFTFLVCVRAPASLGIMTHENPTNWIRSQPVSQEILACDHGTMTIGKTRARLRKIAAGAFKANCLAVMDEVAAKREGVIITKYGKPVARLVPVQDDQDDIYYFLAGKGEITGDVVEPALDLAEWGNLK
ncbi:MAG: type II toxin-antitoxin system Phd/YefM family antitoxin [Terriglobales bacterium]